jgi:hypothetical protein
VFFFKQATKHFILNSRRIKYFRKKIVVRRVFAARFGISSNKKFYHAHKKFKNKKNAILRWINSVEMRLPYFVFNLGWAKSVRMAKFMVQDGYVFLNGARSRNRISSYVAVSDTLALPRRLYRFNYRRYARIFKVRYGFIDWYKGISASRRGRLESFREYRARTRKFHKRFWSTRTLEWKLSVSERLKRLTNFSGGQLLDVSRKKASISLRDRFTAQNFLPLYQMPELSVNRKLIDFFLHSNYF